MSGDYPTTSEYKSPEWRNGVQFALGSFTAGLAAVSKEIGETHKDIRRLEQKVDCLGEHLHVARGKSLVWGAAAGLAASALITGAFLLISIFLGG